MKVGWEHLAEEPVDGSLALASTTTQGKVEMGHVPPCASIVEASDRSCGGKVSIVEIPEPSGRHPGGGRPSS